MIFDFLRERVSQASEPAHVHPHVEVLPFHVAGADVCRVGIARNHALLAANADRRAVPLLFALIRAV